MFLASGYVSLFPCLHNKQQHQRGFSLFSARGLAVLLLTLQLLGSLKFDGKYQMGRRKAAASGKIRGPREAGSSSGLSWGYRFSVRSSAASSLAEAQGGPIKRASWRGPRGMCRPEKERRVLPPSELQKVLALSLGRCQR